MTTPNAEPINITIRATEATAGPADFDLDVKAEGVESQDRLAVILLLVVERITGVSTDPYLALVDAVRRGSTPSEPSLDRDPVEAAIYDGVPPNTGSAS
jgi:hypothetical protein